MSSTSQLNYSALLKDYNDSLNTKLRGFRPAADFLEMWVPDADHSKSLLNMFEAAEMGGVSDFSIVIDANMAKEIDLEQLAVQAASVVKLSFQNFEEGKLIQVSLNKEPAAPKPSGEKDFRSPYRLALGEIAASESPQFEKEISDSGKLTAKVDSVLLSVALSSEGLILQAQHKGAVSPEDKAMLDLVCKAIIDLPLQEAADHAMNKVELALRSRQNFMPVKGIVTPRNADPVFSRPLTLLRDLYAQYKAKSGTPEKVNFYHAPPSAAWRDIPDSEKILKIQKFVDVNFAGTGLRVHRIDGEGAFRIFLIWEGDAPDKGKSLMKLERMLRDQMEVSLEVFLDEWKDQNSKRRL